MRLNAITQYYTVMSEELLEIGEAEGQRERHTHKEINRDRQGEQDKRTSER